MKVDTQRLTEKFLTFLDNLSEEEWKKQVTEGWTVRDIIVHLIGWEKEATKELPTAWKNHQQPWFMSNDDDYKEFNAKNVGEYQGYSPKQLIEEWKNWQEVYQQQIKNIGEDKLRSDYDFFEWVFDEGEGGHYLEHFNQIRQALNK